MQGKFITFEGPDGSGKTTCAKGVYDKLKKEGYDVIYTREPGGIEIAEEIRNIILDPKNTKMDARCEALLYAASRRQHLVEKVLPALAKGQIVLCDRFVDSSLAYQGVGRHLGIEEVFAINKFAIEDNMPDFTIYLNVDPEIGLQRIAARNYKDRLDQESLQFHQDTYNGYLQVVEKYKDRMIVVDANQDEAKVIDDCFKIIKEHLNV